MFPPLPSWDAAHPIIVHIPIGILMVAPLFLVASMLPWRHAGIMAIVTLALMVIGTTGAALAVASGEEAGEAAESVASAEAVLEEHEEAGELSRNLFIGLTIFYAALVALPRVWKRASEHKVHAAISGVFLILNVLALGQLANTGHLGGRLVHEFGVHAPITKEAPAPAASNVEMDDE